MHSSSPGAMHFIVTGRVQGVGFRAATRQKALALGLNGWVCNGRDGRVEGFACGNPADLEMLQSWLRSGPEFARVDHLECRAVAVEPVLGFAITPDIS